MKRKFWLYGSLGVGALALTLSAFQPGVFGQPGANKANKDAVAGTDQVTGLGSISGTVTGPKEFKAAKVYAKNLDKNVTYMVFTEGGKYQALDLFPGNYEVRAEKNGFTSPDAQKVTVSAGGTASANFTLTDGTYRPAQQMRTGVPMNEPLVEYDKLYPPGPGRVTIERSCMRCHGPDFLPNKQWDADQWNAGIDLMMSTAPNSNPPGRINEVSVPGLIQGEERKTLVDYLVKNFGPDSTPRGLAIQEAPIDEKALGKAEFMEYQLPPLPNGKERRFHDEHLSQNGDVWYVDTNGLQIGKMDPRTATWTDYALPDAKYRGHGLIQTKDGDIWVAGHTAFVRIDSKTGEMKFYPYDPNSPRPPHGNTPFADSKESVWTTLMWTNQVAKYDRQTGEVSRFTPPTPFGGIYGMVIDKQDNMWATEWINCKIEKFDTKNEKFTEYTPPDKPCNARRVFVDHAGMVWIPMDWPGKIESLNPKTGQFTSYPEPVPHAFPYDIQEDSMNNLWIADSGQGGGLYKFEPKTKKFTYYPAEQRTDMPKISVSQENSIWYTTRGGSTKTQSLGVLYPDKTKIKTLAAYLVQ
ncbi:MAG TPA: carboxypeptidase regulatory-like domain-containing protein [Candidatus Acidoferrales bacterium]|nr:carboxypeptidase regulatory-like domain-containing protein [Candidatus Acidoferrales bacterium]